MRIAYCIRGKSENFERSAENTLQNMILDMRKHGHEVSVFLNTYMNNSESIINKYSPVKVLLNEFRDYPPMTRVVPLQWKECLEMVKSYQEEKSIEFDVVILTRFDIVFNNLFSEYNIDFEKVNMECIFVPDFMSGDNFILIPKAFFNVSVNVVQNLVDNKINSHETWKHFEQRNVPCHYIGGETSLRGCDYNIMFRLTRCLYPPYQWK
jgi:hypothetical protein